MINRLALEYLKKWALSKKRKPLILRGARQTGKSTLVKMLTEELSLNLVEINFEETSLQSLQKETIQIQDVIHEIELKIERKIKPQSDLIFFDEIQKSPQALMSLRYFYEKFPNVKVIAAGSLLDFLLNEESISFPVGRVDFYYLGPLTFYEFILATKNDLLIEALQKHPKKITEFEHEKLIELWKIYGFVGGMPEVVSEYLENKDDYFSIRKIQNNILHAYKADILKYSKKSEPIRCDKVINYVGRKLGEKVKFTEIDENEKARDLKIAIELLIKARVILLCRHTNANETPLEATADDRIFKLYFLDIGLVNALAFTSIHDLIKNDLVFKGKMTEQMVAQNLKTFDAELDSNLFYWLQDKALHKAEVDFIIHHDQLIIPVEVKSGEKIKSKSLSIFRQHHKKNKVSVYLSQNKFKKTEIETGTLYNIPFYAIHLINELID